jgi:hypothetical protein
VKLCTVRTAASRVFLCRLLLLSTSTILAFTPALLEAHTVEVSPFPGANAGGGPVDSSATLSTRAGTLTTELLDLLTAGQIKSVVRDANEEFFGLDTARNWGYGRDSMGTLSDVQRGGRAVSMGHSTLPDSDLIAWTLTDFGSNQPVNGLAGDGTAPSQTLAGGTTGHTPYNQSNENASIEDHGLYYPFVHEHEKDDFVLSVAGNTKETKLKKEAFSLGDQSDDKVSASAVPEPRFISWLLLAGIMAVALVDRRRSQTA